MSTQLTQSAFEKLSAELEELTTTKRVELAKAIETARMLGDLSENGDYHAAKDEQGKIESRIRQLTAMLREVEIVEVTASDEVAVGHLVTIRYDGDTDTESYLLGHLEERSAEFEVLTPGSALGQVLIGQPRGAKIDYVTPTGSTLKVEIVEIAVP